MSLVFCDSFDHLSTAQLTRKWNAVSVYPQVAAGGRNGTNCLKNTAVSGSYIDKSVPARDTYIAGVAYKPDQVLSMNLSRVITFNVDGGYLCQVCHTATGAVAVYLDTSAYPVGPVATSDNVLLPSTWQYVECKYYIHGSAGRIVVKVDGDTWIDYTGDTIVDGHTTMNQVEFRMDWPYSLDGVCIDDVYICDNQGTVNNDFLGDVQVKCIFPTGAGATSGFARSAGANNYECVDENPIDDADYVSSGALNAVDTYEFGDVSTSGVAVKAVQLFSSAQKSDTGDRAIRHVVRPASTDRVGSVDHYLNTSWSGRMTPFDLNPETGLPFTPTEINDSEFGIKVSV